MDFVQMAANVKDFLHTHLLLSVAALAIVVAFLFYKNPKETFKLLVFMAILGTIGYFIVQIGTSADSGVSGKDEMANKTKKALGE